VIQRGMAAVWERLAGEWDDIGEGWMGIYIRDGTGMDGDFGESWEGSAWGWMGTSKRGI
jgi:hypothetical protein